MVLVMMGGVILSACDDRDNAEVASPGEQCARELDEICPVEGGPESPLDNYAIREIAGYVRVKIGNGDVEGLAALMAEPGEWQQEPWFSVAEETFAFSWMRRDHPITMAASPATVAGLRRVAKTGRNRGARVAAAAALLEVDPELAKATLSDAYAVLGWMEIASGSPGPVLGVSHAPLSAGEYLRDLGVRVVREVCTFEDLERVLKRQPNSEELLALMDEDWIAEGAATLFNQRLRESFLAGTQAQLLPDRFAVAELAAECVRAVKAAGPPEDEGGDFITAEDE